MPLLTSAVLRFANMRVYTRIMTKSPCYCITLRNVSRRLTSLYDEALVPLGINVTQFSQLRNIGRMQPVSLTDLGKRMELDRSTVGRNTRLLERMGLVTSASGEDHRESALALTREGEVLLERALPIWEEVQARISRRLGPGGLEGIVSAFDAIIDDLANQRNTEMTCEPVRQAVTTGERP